VLGLSEFLCRWLYKKNIENLAFSESDLFYYLDREGYWHNIPNKVGYQRLWNDQGRAQFRINSLGFRGPEMPLEKPAGTFRVLFLGDSITIGGRLPEEDIFVTRVAGALARKDGLRYEVANGGIGDVGLYEEERLLQGVGLQTHPDLVVLCWYLNDARPPVGFRDEVVYKNPVIAWFNSQGWLRRSYLAGFIYERVRQAALRRQLHLMDAQGHRFQWAADYMSNHWARDPDALARLVREARYDWGDAWNEDSLAWMSRKIAGLRDLAARHGCRFAVVMMPVQAQVYAGFASALIDQPQRTLAARLRAAGIPYLDLLEPLRPYVRAHPGRQVFYDQCHYNPDGNGLVADAILAFLESSGLLQRGPLLASAPRDF
jgi:lysophospholipase L1-like esterase